MNRAKNLRFRSLSPELSRDFRGLRIWLPLMLSGASAFRPLNEKLDLIGVVETWFSTVTILKSLPAQLPFLHSATARAMPKGILSTEARSMHTTNDCSQTSIGAAGAPHAYRLDGRFVIRVCVLHAHAQRSIKCV